VKNPVAKKEKRKKREKKEKYCTYQGEKERGRLRSKSTLSVPSLHGKILEIRGKEGRGDSAVSLD